MFEGEIITLFLNSTDIVDNISSYAGQPSIFTNEAPEEVDFPYIVFDIRTISPPDSIIDRFMVDIDCYDYKNSGAGLRTLVNSINETLDNQRVNNSRYSDIRIRRDIYSRVPTGDPRAFHYHIQIEARATRKKWMSTI